MTQIQRHSTGKQTSWSTASLGSYPMRMMASLAVSLLLVVLCFHLPIQTPPEAIGWRLRADASDPLLQLLDVKQPSPEEDAGVPSTSFGATEEKIQVGEEDHTGETDSREESAPLPAPATPPPLEKLHARPILEFVDQMPDIEGGIGAYYIHIQYPQAAIEQGIEGRLVLLFVVEPDGKPSEIEITRSLHPLCDSAAVHALRKTRFIPGRQQGNVVRVRMRLPVRFQLIQPPSADSTNTPGRV